MRHTRTFLALAFALAACTDSGTDNAAVAADPQGDAATAPLPGPAAQSVLEAMRTLPTEGLWPGFAPSAIPVALHDGETTLLVGHPAPPAEFRPVAGSPGAFEFVGRHPSVRGNMPTDIAGVRVAAVMLDELSGLSADRAAAVVAHERFHVHQLERHPDWTVNELARFQYPAADAQQLFDRRLETLALHRSMRANTPEQVECWLRTGLILRRKRMSQLPPAVAAYERGMEMQEGLARYIERLAAGIRTPVDIAPDGYAPEDVRGRAYVTGEALGVMLDRYATGWKDVIENAEENPVPLDSLLWIALAPRPERSCGFSGSERAAVLERAEAAVAAMQAGRDSAVARFNAQPGWSVRVITETQPMWPQSFDPMSVTRVGSATLIHERMLRAGNDLGYLDVFERPALSTGYLDDPLGSGIREVRVAGIPDRPVVTSAADGSTRIVAPGIDGAFPSAHVTESGQAIVIRLR